MLREGSSGSAPRIGLRGKLIGSVMVLTISIAVLIVSFELWHLRKTVVQQTVSQGASIADTIASTAGYYVIFDLTDDLKAIISDLAKHDEVEYADFVTADGKVLASTTTHPLPTTLGAIKLSSQPYSGTMNEGDQRLHNYIRPFFETRADAASATAKPRGYFRLSINESHVQQALRNLVFSSVFITLIALVIGVLVTVSGARVLIRPIIGVVESATQIASGDLTQRTEVTSTDELGSLGRSFNDMAVNLEKTISQVARSQAKVSGVVDTVGSRSSRVMENVDEQRTVLDEAYQSVDQLNSGIRKISDNVEALSASSEETSSSILEMVASMEEVSRHTDTLYSSVEETASATTEMVSSIAEVDSNVDFLQTFVTETSASMTEMSASIGQVQTNAARSYDVAVAVADAAQSGMSAVRETIEGMEQIRVSVLDASSVVSRLGERSAEIGKILNVIEDVAEQTNLLALNAAILAAQAGEHGKGFSVVAAEIRDLSERTASSTRDIAELITAVQAEVTNANRTMADGSVIVEKGVSLSHEAGKALNRILESSSKASEMGKEIASATREQAKGSEAVATAIERLQEMVRQINSATRQQSSGSDHIMRAVESMREVTRYVRQAMVEQKSGSTMISKAAERMIDMVHEIFEVTASQASESEKIVTTMERVRDIAENNKRSASEMSGAIGSLSEAIRGLDEEVRRFRIRA